MNCRQTYYLVTASIFTPGHPLQIFTSLAKCKKFDVADFLIALKQDTLAHSEVAILYKERITEEQYNDLRSILNNPKRF